MLQISHFLWDLENEVLGSLGQFLKVQKFDFLGHGSGISSHALKVTVEYHEAVILKYCEVGERPHIAFLDFFPDSDSHYCEIY